MSSKPTRRQFVTGSVLFTLAFAGWHAFGRRPVSDREKATLALALGAFLEDDAAGARAAAVLAESLDDDQTEQLQLALNLLEFAPGGPLTATRFSRLDLGERAAVVQAWQGSRLGVRRQVAASLRQAARFIHFSDEATWAAIGYDGPWL